MRAAIYFTPPASHELTQRAAAWLGRDPFTGQDVAPASGPPALTSRPARYGFHATLKAPFRIAPPFTLAGLDDALRAFAATRTPINLGPLAISSLGGFFALVPSNPPVALNALEQAVVASFDHFRTPLDEADIARRNPDALTDKQRENLMKWGYPHVGAEYRFHMTLTDSVDADSAPGLHEEIRRHFEGILERPLELDALSLFVEEAPGAPFTVRTRHPLKALASAPAEMHA